MHRAVFLTETTGLIGAFVVGIDGLDKARVFEILFCGAAVVQAEQDRNHQLVWIDTFADVARAGFVTLARFGFEGERITFCEIVKGRLIVIRCGLL